MDVFLSPSLGEMGHSVSVLSGSYWYPEPHLQQSLPLPFIFIW